MLRMFSVLILCSSAAAVAQATAVQPATPPVAAVQPAPPADAQASVEPADAPEAVEEPQMKKVCHSQEVVGSAIPRTVCVMKPVRKPKG
jgi:hypothetical protein